LTSPAYIAFQGGGVLGMAHLGAWQVLSQQFACAGVAGTSAGSIVAALCASGFDPPSAIKLFRGLDWKQFVRPQHAFQILIQRNAWSDGKRFYQWLLNELAVRFPDHRPTDVTFAWLYQQTQIYLAVFACDLNDAHASPIEFSSKTDAETLVAFAVRASISIPGVFAPVPQRSRGQELVDGGVLLNFPVEHLHPLARKRACPLIGVRFTQPSPPLDTPHLGQILDRSYRLLTAAGNLPPPAVSTDPQYIDVVIDAADFNPFQFNLTTTQKDELLRRGADAAREALLRYQLRLAQVTHATASPYDEQATSATPPPASGLPPITTPPLALSSDERERIRERLQILRRRLQKLQKKADYDGVSVAPEVAMEIEDLQGMMAELEQKLG